MIEEYSDQLVKLGGRLMKILSVNLGLGEDYLQNAFGGKDFGACLRVNFYPKCPQPDLALGLSSHSDPGGMTLLLPDQDVAGLQVRKNDNWITVKPAKHAFIVNIGDQIQVLSISLSQVYYTYIRIYYPYSLYIWLRFKNPSYSTWRAHALMVLYFCMLLLNFGSTKINLMLKA